MSHLHLQLTHYNQIITKYSSAFIQDKTSTRLKVNPQDIWMKKSITLLCT